MKVYVGQARGRELITELVRLGWGEMTQPKELPARRRPFALDNYAFASHVANKPWDEAAFVAALEHCTKRKTFPDFVVAPDIVMGGWKSLEFSLSWSDRLTYFQSPTYLAVQDGMTIDGITKHLKTFDGIFVGGSAAWKITSGFWWVSLAHAVGKPCHVGRISGRERVRLVKSWGADSIDSCVPLWSKENREAVVKGLADPPVEFEIPDPSQFMTGWETL